MTLEDILLGRRSIRAFEPDPPSRELVENALRIASFAPNAGNRQQLVRVAVTDKAELERIGRAQTVLRAKFNRGEPLAATESELAAAPSAFYDAPLAVALFAPKSFFFAAADAYIHAHALCLAAHSLGLGSCIVGGVGNAVGAEMSGRWGVPATHAPQCYVLLGRPRGPIPSPHSRKYAPVLWVGAPSETTPKGTQP